MFTDEEDFLRQYGFDDLVGGSVEHPAGFFGLTEFSAEDLQGLDLEPGYYLVQQFDNGSIDWHHYKTWDGAYDHYNTLNDAFCEWADEEYGL